MKHFLPSLILFSFSLCAFGQSRSLEQDIRTKYCYLTVTEQIIIQSAKDSVMVGNIKLNLATRDYQKTRRLLPGRTFKVKSIDGSVFSLDDAVIKSFCVTNLKECLDISDNNKMAFSSLSQGGLKMICEDRPLVDI